MPLYDADVEVRGIPESVTSLKDTVPAAEGLILPTPEYNNSIPGSAQECHRFAAPADVDIKRVFCRMPVALIGATPGGFGTILSQAAWLPVPRRSSVAFNPHSPH